MKSTVRSTAPRRAGRLIPLAHRPRRRLPLLFILLVVIAVPAVFVVQRMATKSGR